MSTACSTTLPEPFPSLMIASLRHSKHDGELFTTDRLSVQYESDLIFKADNKPPPPSASSTSLASSLYTVSSSLELKQSNKAALSDDDEAERQCFEEEEETPPTTLHTVKPPTVSLPKLKGEGEGEASASPKRSLLGWKLLCLIACVALLVGSGIWQLSKPQVQPDDLPVASPSPPVPRWHWSSIRSFLRQESECQLEVRVESRVHKIPLRCDSPPQLGVSARAIQGKVASDWTSVASLLRP